MPSAVISFFFWRIWWKSVLLLMKNWKISVCRPRFVPHAESSTYNFMNGLGSSWERRIQWKLLNRCYQFAATHYKNQPWPASYWIIVLRLMMRLHLRKSHRNHSTLSTMRLFVFFKKMHTVSLEKRIFTAPIPKKDRAGTNMRLLKRKWDLVSQRRVLKDDQNDDNDQYVWIIVQFIYVCFS